MPPFALPCLAPQSLPPPDQRSAENARRTLSCDGPSRPPCALPARRNACAWTSTWPRLPSCGRKPLEPSSRTGRSLPSFCSFPSARRPRSGNPRRPATHGHSAKPTAIRICRRCQSNWTRTPQSKVRQKVPKSPNGDCAQQFGRAFGRAGRSALTRARHPDRTVWTVDGDMRLAQAGRNPPRRPIGPRFEPDAPWGKGWQRVMDSLPGRTVPTPTTGTPRRKRTASTGPPLPNSPVCNGANLFSCNALIQNVTAVTVTVTTRVTLISCWVVTVY